MRGAPLIAVLLCAWCGLTAAPAAADTEFYVRRAETHLEEGVYRLDARIQYRFSEESLEALRSGVAITIVVGIDVERRRQYLWNETVASLRQRYQLSHHALSARYILTNLNTGISTSYATYEGAVDSLGRLDAFPLIDAELLDPEQDYLVELKTYLDIEALPAPLRPVAYFSSAWRLSSDAFTCPLTP